MLRSQFQIKLSQNALFSAFSRPQNFITEKFYYQILTASNHLRTFGYIPFESSRKIRYFSLLTHIFNLSLHKIWQIDLNINCFFRSRLWKYIKWRICSKTFTSLTSILNLLTGIRTLNISNHFLSIICLKDTLK